jgi:hypothetical protein
MVEVCTATMALKNDQQYGKCSCKQSFIFLKQITFFSNEIIFHVFFLHNFTLSIIHIVPVHFVEMLYKCGKGPSRIDRAPTF